MINWAAPAYLWLLSLALPLLILALLAGRRGRRELAKVAGADAVAGADRPGAAGPGGHRVSARVLLSAAFLLLVAALCGPQWGVLAEERRSEGVEIIIALDTSRSMLADDLGPSRLAAAKEAVGDLAAQLRGDRIGLIAFAGSAFLVCPLTTDYGAFCSALAETGVESIPLGGSSLAAPLEEAKRAFAGTKGEGRVLIVISDGEDHGSGYSAAARQLNESGIKLFSVAAGTPRGGLIPLGRGEFLKDRGGNVVLSRSHQAPLSEIAAAAGGRLIDLGAGKGALAGLYRQDLATLQRNSFTGKGTRLRERYQIPLALALALLFLEPLTGCWRKR